MRIKPVKGSGRVQFLTSFLHQVEARQKLILEAEEGKQKNGKTVDPDEVGMYSCETR
jgi:hypothetical protein